MRPLWAILVLSACGSPATMEQPDASPAVEVDAAVDAASGVPLSGFGELGGMCGILEMAELTGPTPTLFRDTFGFARRYKDPDDRPLLTPGGRHLAETPNAGGSSGLSEVFAYEQLARCELAALVKTETEIVYDNPGKITDLEVMIDGHMIGVSVTRAQTFPLGQPYTLSAASTLLTRKLQDIQLSTANVSAADRWEKQVLAILAYDDQAADTMTQAWMATDASTKADTIVVLTVTGGEDVFIYTNN